MAWPLNVRYLYTQRRCPKSDHDMFTKPHAESYRSRGRSCDRSRSFCDRKPRASDQSTRLPQHAATKVCAAATFSGIGSGAWNDAAIAARASRSAHVNHHTDAQNPQTSPPVRAGSNRFVAERSRRHATRLDLHRRRHMVGVVERHLAYRRHRGHGLRRDRSAGPAAGRGARQFRRSGQLAGWPYVSRVPRCAHARGRPDRDSPAGVSRPADPRGDHRHMGEPGSGGAHRVLRGHLAAPARPPSHVADRCSHQPRTSLTRVRFASVVAPLRT